MKLFIWQRAENVTDHYHREAGVACIAESLEAAREMLEPLVAEDTREKCSVFTALPDVTREAEGPAGAWIFPDAGCC